jgi:hypothetical protein
VSGGKFQKGNSWFKTTLQRSTPDWKAVARDRDGELRAAGRYQKVS